MNSEYTIEIAAAPETIWFLITDREKTMQWNPDILSIEPRTPGPPVVGLVSDTKIKEGSRVVDYEGEITAFQPPAYLELRLTGGSLGASPMVVGYRLTPTTDGTSVCFTGAWQARGIVLRLLAPLLAILGRRNATVAMGRLKAMAESPAE